MTDIARLGATASISIFFGGIVLPSTSLLLMHHDRVSQQLAFAFAFAFPQLIS